MGAISGRRVKVRWDGRAILGLRSKSIEFGGEPIDITDANSAGVRELLKNPAGDELEVSERHVNISGSGVLKDGVLLRAMATATGLVREVEVELENIGTLVGEFAMTTKSLEAPHDDSTTYTFDLQSTGDWDWSDA